MSTNPLSPDAQAVVRAAEALTTQVRRIADTLKTAVVETVAAAADDKPTTGVRIPLPGIPECGPGCFCRRNDTEQQAPAADEDALRTARRDSIGVLLSRAERVGLALDEATLLRQHVEAEMKAGDTARAEAEYHQQLSAEQGQAVSRATADREGMRGLLAAENKRADAAIERETAAEQAAVEATQHVLELKAAIERVRAQAIAQRARGTSGSTDHKIGLYDAAVAILAALDGTEQPTTEG